MWINLIPKRRRARRGPWRSEKYRRWIAQFSCLICSNPHTQAAHISHNGMASKGPDNETVPACPIHHDQIDGRMKLPNGELGKAAFEQYYGVDLSEVAATFRQIYQRNS